MASILRDLFVVLIPLSAGILGVLIIALGIKHRLQQSRHQTKPSTINPG